MADPTSKYITEIVADPELNVALQNFNTVCSANAIALGLNPANLLEISGAATSFTSSLNTWVGSRSSANQALDNKNLQKKSSKAVISKWAKTFRANQTVPDGLLDQLMLPPHKTPGSKTPPTTPLNLVANADGQGLVKLAWKRNGNIETTQFAVEYRLVSGGAWSILDTTKKTKYTHQATPGVYIAFRVTAKRDGLTSPASVPVVLWEDGVAEPQLSVAA
ncbi:MAG: fibronectin type III domain-containing protein [Armatimonadetes bacterium]|nr:fibronectin type III domain-containing protein [Armatimonadota bacterium]